VQSKASIHVLLLKTLAWSPRPRHSARRMSEGGWRRPKLELPPHTDSLICSVTRYLISAVVTKVQLRLAPSGHHCLARWFVRIKKVVFE
jgi:hypothetical protein